MTPLTIPSSDIIRISDSLTVVVDRKVEINIGDWYFSNQLPRKCWRRDTLCVSRQALAT